ncbi:MAG: phosphoribosylformylglycinamidine cyclo-ligase [Gemmatales bacterium]|nr:phosphoribosylformylglycinamidine cyclo-ligase [Gemmatales bacterium]MDW8387852.1 phosphoribosylformylglycinamidine cyclo-ligase [Gemmatales bacterium]
MGHGSDGMAGFTYRDAGLNLELYQESLEAIAPLLKRTQSGRVLDRPSRQKVGGKKSGFFASLFSLDWNGKLFARNYRRPVLVACTDGVGSKLKVAMLMNKHDTVGIDLVAMSVNDCLCSGGEPLFFLDYLAMSRDDPELTRQIVRGISDGCLEAECALVGGETAILPDFYQPGEYDLAGFCVGVVERSRIVDGRSIVPGDVILGLESSGLHSNGYSLVRKVVFDHARLKVSDYVPELGRTVGEELLEPTRIYARAVKEVLRHYPVKRVVRGMAHITGGGLVDNLPRILPANLQALLRRDSWPVPPVFSWVQRLGNIAQEEMDRVFNLGIGFVLIVRPHFASSIQRRLEAAGTKAHVIGTIRRGGEGVVFV